MLSGEFNAPVPKTAVYTLCRWTRNEAQRPSPLLVGLGRVYTAPKALAGGTAG